MSDEKVVHSPMISIPITFIQPGRISVPNFMSDYLNLDEKMRNTTDSVESSEKTVLEGERR